MIYENGYRLSGKKIHCRGKRLIPVKTTYCHDNEMRKNSLFTAYKRQFISENIIA